MKIVINATYGGYGLSKEAYEELGLKWTEQNEKNKCGSVYYDDRTNPYLVAMVEKLGSEIASGSCARLKIVEIPDDVEWVIDEYDGWESIHEVHRVWK